MEMVQRYGHISIDIKNVQRMLKILDTENKIFFVLYLYLST
jgi:hypothetical protein